jgi:hypothetical protein
VDFFRPLKKPGVVIQNLGFIAEMGVIMNLKCLEKELGKALSAREVAKYLNLNFKTVIKYYQQLGGIRLGRNYRFFEKEIIKAVQKWTEREQVEQEVFNEEGCPGVGNEDAAKTRRRLKWEDRHGIF